MQVTHWALLRLLLGIHAFWVYPGHHNPCKDHLYCRLGAEIPNLYESTQMLKGAYMEHICTHLYIFIYICMYIFLIYYYVSLQYFIL